MSLLIKLRNLLIVIKIFYWLAFKAALKALSRKDLALAHRFWAQSCCEYFKVSFHKLQNSKEMRRQKTLLLTNHRTQADFFVHQVIADHQSNFLSRLLVGIVFFVFYFASKNSLWFFNRSGNIDPQKFNNWLDQKFRKSQRPLLLAYPQGHRMGAITNVDKLKLKTGLIRYAFRRGMPVQILITFGNEKVFNEKKLEMKWNEKVYYSFSKVYLPSDYQTQNQFVTFMKDQFSQFFDQIYQQYTQKKEQIKEKDKKQKQHNQ